MNSISFDTGQGIEWQTRLKSKSYFHGSDSVKYYSVPIAHVLLISLQMHLWTNISLSLVKSQINHADRPCTATIMTMWEYEQSENNLFEWIQCQLSIFNLAK
eukprot:GHVU01068874.1.p1 GENE.GHVU01068874.1~~GHVU01068874.1.p1  ORF type:complete len:102 (-),score=1.90 GHVU01068874.1:576-881(-)